MDVRGAPLIHMLNTPTVCTKWRTWVINVGYVWITIKTGTTSFGCCRGGGHWRWPRKAPRSEESEYPCQVTILEGKYFMMVVLSTCLTCYRWTHCIWYKEYWNIVIHVTLTRPWTYGQELLVRHCVDVMHCEKNLCKNLLKTILEEKDKPQTRMDMQERGIRKALWLQPVGIGGILSTLNVTVCSILTWGRWTQCDLWRHQIPSVISMKDVFDFCFQRPGEMWETQ